MDTLSKNGGFRTNFRKILDVNNDYAKRKWEDLEKAINALQDFERNTKLTRTLTGVKLFFGTSCGKMPDISPYTCYRQHWSYLPRKWSELEKTLNV